MGMEDVVTRVTQAVSKEGNASVVFGEPMKLDDKTVIPVAAVRLAAAGAGMTPTAPASRVLKAVIGGGGGGSFDVRPVGFIHERGGEVVFTAIHLDVRGRPFLAEAASGLGRLFDSASSLATTAFHRRVDGARAQKH